MLKNVKNLLFANITNRQTLAKNAFWLAVGNLGGRLIRAAIIIYAARILGAAGWGVFSYGITLVAFLTIFVDIGIDAILTRESAKAKGDIVRQGQIISTSLSIKILLLAIGVFVVVFTAPKFASIPEVIPLLNMMALILVFDTFRNFGFSLIRSREKMEIEAGLYIFTNIAIVAFGFGALYLHPTVKAFTLAYAVGTAAGLIATLFVLRKDAATAFSNFSKPLVKEILSSAWPFAISGVLGLLLLNTDILIIGMFRKAQDVGFYSAAVRVIQLLYIFAGTVAQSSLPIFSRFVKEEKARIRTAIQNILRFALSFSFVVAFSGIAGGREIITLLFGSEYLPATLSFQILLLTFAFSFVAVILNNVVFVYDKQKILIIYAAIGGLTNVALDLLLIPPYGISGSAVATLISSIIADSYLWYVAWKIVGFDLNLKLGKIFSSAIISSILFYALLKTGVNVILAIPLAAASYLALIHFFKEPLLEEIRYILNAGRNAGSSEENASQTKS